MKIFYATAICLFILISLYSQDATLILNGVDYQGNIMEKGIVDFAGANAMLIPNVTMAKIRNELEFLRIQAHEDSIQKNEFKKIIKAYKDYETGADTLIKSQKALLDTANVLYEGYKDLYHDLKKLCRINSYSIIPGIGLVNIREIEPKINLVFNVVFEYNKLNINAMIGKKYQGASLGYRIGF